MIKIKNITYLKCNMNLKNKYIIIKNGTSCLANNSKQFYLF